MAKSRRQPNRYWFQDALCSGRDEDEGPEWRLLGIDLPDDVRQLVIGKLQDAVNRLKRESEERIRGWKQ